MDKQQTAQEHPSYIFNIEVLIESEHNAAALEQLLRNLNGCDFLDYRILSGVRLGELIDQRKAMPSSVQAVPVSIEPEPSVGFENIRKFMKNNTLIRLIVNKGLGIKLSIPCRIINIDEAEQLITVYHVDEKQVYTFRLNEIEDMVE